MARPIGIVKHTNEFLLEELKRYYDEFGEVPTQKKLDKNKYYPGANTYKKRFGSLKEALNLIGLQSIRDGKKSVHYNVKNDYENGDSLDDIAIKYNFRKEYVIGILNRFNIKIKDNTWSKEEINFLMNNYINMTNKEISEHLETKTENQVKSKRNNEKLEKRSFIINQKYKNIENDYLNGMSPKDIAIKYDYNNETAIFPIINKLNLPKKNNQWTKEQLNILREKYPYEEWEILINLLKPFSKDDITHKAYVLDIKRSNFYWDEEEIKILNENYDKISPQKLQVLFPNRTYGSIVTKANKLGLIHQSKWTDEEIIKIKELYSIMDNKDLIKLFPNRKIHHLIDMAQKLNIHKDYSSDYFLQKHENNKKDAIIALKSFANELGRTPLGQEITDNKDMPGIVTYIRYFGGYREACVEANLEPNSNSIYNKKIYLSNNNDICLSKAELIITNYMIDINMDYIKEYLYRDIINDTRCGLKRMDWLINDSIIVEFFGMPKKDFYRVKMEEKIKICNDNEIILIDLYPTDLRYNLQGVKKIN